MKKAKIILVILSLFIGSTAFGQVAIEGGYVRSTLFLSEGDNVGVNNFYGGVTYNIGFKSSAFMLEPGIFFQYGKKNDIFTHSFSDDSEVSEKLTQTYLTIPIMLNYGVNVGQSVVRFYAGPTVFAKLSGKVKSTYEDSNSSTSDSWDADEYCVDGGMMLGAGIGFELIDRIRIKVGYDYDIFNHELEEDDKTIDRHWGQFHVGLAIIL